MTVAAELVMAAGSLIAALAGIGLLRFSTPSARIQAAGKASPVALVLTSVGAGPLLGWAGSAYLAIAAAAMIVTLPVVAHLLLRAVHRTSNMSHLSIDDLGTDERRGGDRVSGDDRRGDDRGIEPPPHKPEA